MTSPKPKIMFIQWSWFCSDIIDAMIDAGMTLHVLQRSDPALLERLRQALRSFNPDFLFSINFNPLLSEFAHRNQIPYAAWNIDNLASSTFCSDKYAWPTTHIFTIERPSMKHYRLNGFDYVHYLPIAVNLNRFTHADTHTPSRDLDITFVGNSMITEGNEYPTILNRLVSLGVTAPTPEDQQLYSIIKDAIETIVDSECSNFFSYQLEAKLKRTSEVLGFDLAKAIWKDPDFFHIALAKQISSKKRVALIHQLSDYVPVHVFGDDDWQSVHGRYLQFYGRADHFTDTPDIYQRSRICLNIEKTYNRSSINLRMIEALACGAMPLTEPVEDLELFFEPGHNIVTYTSFKGLKEKAAYYLKHEDERQIMVQRGMQRVHESFSLTTRVQELATAMTVSHTPYEEVINHA